MTYKVFIIDMFNLAYKNQTKIATPTSIANNVINFINEEVKQRLEDGGNIYLAYDPLPKSDLGMDKNFKFSTTRQQIKGTYKSNRTYNHNVLAALKMLRKYYSYRGEHIRTVISDELEADDFVEGILQFEKEGSVALVTTDLDWARYIDDRVQMINAGFDKPFTKDDFFNKYGYFPTVVSITLMKALFGDPSDNIEPVLTKKFKILKDNDDFVKALIKEISKKDYDLESIRKRVDKAVAIEVFSNASLDEIDEILSVVSVSKNALEEFKKNIRVIKCRCDDVRKYIYWKKEDTGYNNLMETTLGRKASSDQKFKFGNIKIK